VKDDLEAAAGGLDHDPPHACKLVHLTGTEKLFNASPPPQGSDGERSREVTHVGPTFRPTQPTRAVWMTPISLIATNSGAPRACRGWRRRGGRGDG
jgi:hypothetical protein